jgi:hypothetical protein
MGCRVWLGGARLGAHPALSRLEELRAVLLGEHVGRVRDGLV